MSITLRDTKWLTIAALAAAALPLGGCGQSDDSADAAVFTLTMTADQECTLTGPEEVPAGTFTIVVEDKEEYTTSGQVMVVRLDDTTYEEFRSWREPENRSELRILPRATLDHEATREFNESQDLPESAVAFSYVSEPGTYVLVHWPPRSQWFGETTDCGTIEVR